MMGFIGINKKVCSWMAARIGAHFDSQDYVAITVGRINALLAEKGHSDVLEAGGIDRPLLRRSPALTYVGLDIESRESCAAVYDDFIVQSIELPVDRTFDLIISSTLLEHVRDNRAAMQTCYNALRSGGAMVHYLPSKYHPYSLILRLVSPALQRRIIGKLRPEVAAVTGYPAYFDHCSPREMEALLAGQGFRDVRITPFYNAAVYFDFFVPMFVAVVLWEHLCRGLGLRRFCSGFLVSATRR